MGRRVYLGLGSNVGDRYGHLIEAIDRLRACVTIDTISSIYETEPWGYADQPPFLNTVCGGETDAAPQELFGAAHHITVHRESALLGVIQREQRIRGEHRSRFARPPTPSAILILQTVQASESRLR